MAGSTTSSTTSSTCVITYGCVTTSISSAPTPITRLRSPSEKDDPTTVCTTVVSVVRRDSTSPVWVCSKKAGLCSSTWA